MHLKNNNSEHIYNIRIDKYIYMKMCRNIHEFVIEMIGTILTIFFVPVPVEYTVLNSSLCFLCYYSNSIEFENSTFSNVVTSPWNSLNMFWSAL